MLEPLFNKVGNLKAGNFINQRLQQRCFPVNIEDHMQTAASAGNIKTFHL